MAANAFFVLCAHAILVQMASAQYCNRAPIAPGQYNPMQQQSSKQNPFTQAQAPFTPMPSPLSMTTRNSNWPNKNLALDTWPSKGVSCATPAIDITSTSGGSLPVTSSSAIAPTGVSVVSENVYEGALTVAGEVPFVGSTSVDGVLPTAGAGATNYGCGDGVTAMVSENVAPVTSAIAPAATITAAVAPTGFSPSGVSPTGFSPSGVSPTGISSTGISSVGISPSSRFGCGRGLMY